MSRFGTFGFTLILLSTVLTAAEPPVTVDFELHKNVIFVRASVGDSAPLDMALDSGGVRTTLDESVASRLGLDLSMRAMSSGAKGMQEISVLKGLTLRFAGLEVSEPLAVAYPLDFLAKTLGRRVDGIIGVELFRKYVVEIDYPAQKLRVFAPETYSYDGPAEAIPVKYDRRLPIVTGSITPFGGKPIPARFQVDTGGARATVMLWKGFIEKHRLAAGVHDVTQVPVTAFTGTTTQKQGRIQELQIGKVTVSGPTIGLNDFQYGDPTVFDGNLGSGFLKQFKVIFDLPHDRLMLERPVVQ